MGNRSGDLPLAAAQPTTLAPSSLCREHCICQYFTITFYRIWAAFFTPFRLRLAAAPLMVLLGTLFQLDCTVSLFWRDGVVLLLSVNFFNQFLSVVTDSGRTTFPWNHRGSFLLRECLWSIGEAQSITGTTRRKETGDLHSFPRRAVDDISFLVQTLVLSLCRNIREQLVIYFWKRFPFRFSVSNIRRQIWFIHKYYLYYRLQIL